MKLIQFALSVITKLPYGKISVLFQTLPGYIQAFEKANELKGFEKLEKIVTIIKPEIEKWLPKDKVQAASTVATIAVAAIRLYYTFWKK